MVLPSVLVVVGQTKESLQEDEYFLVAAITLVSLGTDAMSYYHLSRAYVLIKTAMFRTSLGTISRLKYQHVFRDVP